MNTLLNRLKNLTNDISVEKILQMANPIDYESEKFIFYLNIRFEHLT